MVGAWSLDIGKSPSRTEEYRRGIVPLSPLFPLRLTLRLGRCPRVLPSNSTETYLISQCRFLSAERPVPSEIMTKASRVHLA